MIKAVLRQKYLSLFLLSVASVSCLDHESSQLNIINGVDMPWQDFPEVVYLDMGCTATFVDKNVLLTAAHCTNGRRSVRYLHRNANGSSQYITSSRIVENPNYDINLNNGVNGNDLALIWLPGDYARRVANICSSVPGDSYFDIVGFGCNKYNIFDTEERCEGSGPNNKRWGGNVMRGTPTDMIRFVGVSEGGATPEDPRNNFAKSGQGDSGGPLFTTVNGTRCLAGVTSGSQLFEGGKLWRSSYVNLGWTWSTNFLRQNMAHLYPIHGDYLNKQMSLEPFGLVETYATLNSDSRIIFRQPRHVSVLSDMNFNIRPGLASPSCLSFEKNGQYLYAALGSDVRIGTNTGTAEFRSQATFCPTQSPINHEWLRLNAYSSRRHVLIASDGVLKLLDTAGSTRRWSMNATFRFVPAHL